MNRKNFFGTLILALGISLLGGCNKEPEWQEVDPTELNLEDARTVLVEEYTGQNCPNCPAGAQVLEELSKVYPKNVITVAMHAEWTGKTLDELRSEGANNLAQEFDIPRTIPGVMINRTKIEGEIYSTSRQKWTGLIQEQLNAKAPFRLSIEQTRNDRQLELNINSKNTASLGNLDKRDLGITVWIVEDIYAQQQVGGVKEGKYLHHNVLRDVIKDREPYELQTELSLTATLSEKVVNPENAKVIAFISDKSTQEVYETALLPLGKGIGSGGSTGGSDDPVDKITVSVGEQEIDPSEEIKHDENSFNDSGDVIYLASPYVDIRFPEKYYGKEVQANVTVLDHEDNPDCGLSSVCLDVCKDFVDSFKKQFETTFEVSEMPISANIKYGFKKTVPLNDTYRVQLTLTSEGEELVKLVFNYKPKNTAPEPPEGVYFLLNGEIVDPTQEIVNDSQMKIDNALMLNSPYLSAKIPTDLYGKKITVSFTALDHGEEEGSGMVSVCVIECPSFDEPLKNYEVDFIADEYTSPNIGIHYSIPLTYPEGEIYRVKMLMTCENKEIAALTFAFKPVPEE